MRAEALMRSREFVVSVGVAGLLAFGAGTALPKQRAANRDYDAEIEAAITSAAPSCCSRATTRAS
jgi:hypothetical protein